MRNHKIRHMRKKVSRQLKRGEAELRVFGTSESGYVLGGHLDKSFIALTSIYDTQKSAVEVGQVRFGQKAKKLLSLGKGISE